MVDKQSVYAHIKNTGHLPILPEILLKILEVCDNDSTSLAELAAVISKDPALSFRVLQLVNSSYYGLRSTFTGIEQAVVYLGANSIKNIALATSIHQVFEPEQFGTVKRFNIGAFWWHSFMCATLAKRLAVRTGFVSVDEAYLSGLLLNIGRLVLISTYPREHESILLETEDVRNQLWAETQLIGINHCEAGGWLVQNWKLDSLMADAIRYHHEPLEQIQEAFPLVKIVHVANLLADAGGDCEPCGAAAELLLDLDGAALGLLADGAIDEVVMISESLGIKVQPSAGAAGRGTSPDSPVNGAAGGRKARQPCVEVQSREESRGQNALKARIKSISLLSGFLENLVQAGDIEAIIAAFEQAMNLLFSIDKTLFFLPDDKDMLLKGSTSPGSRLHQLAKGLALPVQLSSSLIVKSYLENEMAYLTFELRQKSLADEQMLRALHSSTILIVPLSAENRPTGVILLGLPESAMTVADSDVRLIRVIAQQVGLCLHLERTKIRKAREIEAERLAAISLTARKLAHEINNPLGIISNYLAAMHLKLGPEHDIQEELGIVGEEIQRISSLLNQLDPVAEKTAVQLEEIEVNAVLADIIGFVRASLFEPAGMRVLFEPDPHLPTISSSADALKQIMINLLKNAAEAMAPGDYAAVRTARSTGRRRGVGNMPADGIEIVITDTGPGLPDQVRENLFKPFVTTKSGCGGLGLSIVQKTVEQIGGSVTCSDSSAEGTSFTIFLPMVND